MPSKPIKRVSALASNYTRGPVDSDGKIGVLLQEVPDLNLWQVAAWPDCLAEIGQKTADAIGVEEAPGPGRAAMQGNQALLRVEPLKFWVIGASAPQILPSSGAILDLSHSRTHVRVAGPEAQILLNRYLPLDLREPSFTSGAVASTVFHHIGVTLWRSPSGFELFLPRSFALSLWELLCQGAGQFGYEVT
jgi:heterotetrameric sarcosine oxidase gamma subunit